jgi:hypothetical protein
MLLVPDAIREEKPAKTAFQLLEFGLRTQQANPCLWLVLSRDELPTGAAASKTWQHFTFVVGYSQTVESTHHRHS